VQLRSLAQLNFRNLTTPLVTFESGVIALVGRNASGKSNLLDAAYLALTGELPSGKIVEALRFEHSQGYVAAELEHDEGLSRIEVGLAPGRKQLKLDGQFVRAFEIARVSAAVLITPQDADLVHGSPSGRRSYLDTLLTKLSPRYGALTREYHRVVEQRNALLKGKGPDASFEVWGQRFVELGTEIDELRTRAVVRIGALANTVYREVADDGKAYGVALRRSRGEAPLVEALAATAYEERARGATVVGPHRDDLLLTLDDRTVAAYGSRGEARTAALALRVAEYRLLNEKHDQAPVLLLDDFSAELDQGRRGYLLDLIATTPQTLVSGTEAPPRADATLRVRDGEILADGDDEAGDGG
jgi:DNA replication and repair protein RecF